MAFLTEEMVKALVVLLGLVPEVDIEVQVSQI
jgi:hypothetical protein